MQYIIMCGGKYSGAKNLRQLYEVNGEPIVARTIRLLKECGVDNIAISSDRAEFEQFDVPVLHHDNSFDNGSGEWLDCFYPTTNPTCYLFGDVLFSKNAIRHIVDYQVSGVQFFASSPPFHPLYIKKHAEPFAFKVQDMQSFFKVVDKAKKYEKVKAFARKPAISWELWQVLTGERLNHINYNTYCTINDYTCDIDREEDIHSMIQKGVDFNV